MSEPVLWRIADYWQDPEPATSEPRDTFASVRADLDEWAQDFTYIERKVGDGPWVRVAFAGIHPELPDAWTYDPVVTAISMTVELPQSDSKETT